MGFSSWNGFVYAIGRLTTQFPTLGVEKEFTQLTEGVEQGGLIETALLRRTLDAPENRYLGRHLCWVFTTQHVDTFAVLPRDDTDIARLVEMISPAASENIIHVMVGRSTRAELDSPCAGLGLPAVVADQLLAFTLDEFAEALPGGDTTSVEEASGGDQAELPERDQDRKQFQAVVRELFLRLTRRAENRGIADEHRALNYVALRYPPIYHTAMQAYRENKMLVGIDARQSPSATRRVVAVRLTFRQRRTDIIERYHCLVDVTDVFPFLVSPLTVVYD
jgi:hypothetical protein